MDIKIERKRRAEVTSGQVQVDDAAKSTCKVESGGVNPESTRVKSVQGVGGTGTFRTWANQKDRPPGSAGPNLNAWLIRHDTFASSAQD